MVGTNKVLTVSYGTFSCTLEGFDDSFSTMKAIAEYFRDLAADDRYFGAEPPTPDAEMMARIAQREISRNVEAKVGERGVILRAAPDMAVPSPDSAQETAAPAETEAAPEAQATPAPAPAPQPETASQPEPEFEPVEPDDDLSSVAAKLRRIRSVVQHAPLADTPSIYNEDQDAAAFFEGTAEAPQAEAEAEAEAETEAKPEAAAEAAVASQETEAETAPEPEGEAEQAEAEQAEIEAEIEDTPEAEEEIAAAPQGDQQTGDTGADASGDADADTQDGDDDHAALSSVVSKLAMADASEDDFEEDEAADTSDISFIPPAEETGAEAASDSDDSDDSDEADEADEAAEQDAARGEDIIDFAALAAHREGAGKAETAQDEAEADEAGTQEEPAEAETAKEESAAPLILEETDKDEGDEPQPAKAEAKDGDDSSLSEEDEADLMAELAEVEAETDSDDQDETAPAAADEAGDDTPAVPVLTPGSARAIRQSRRAVLTEDLAPDDASLTRILKHTNSEMQSGEGSRRRAAIAHLKAAVAATVADRKTSARRPSDTTEETAPYREDLAEVVRPRRISSRGSQQRPPMAPLMLVSEQRIDKPSQPGEAGNLEIHPRRVAKGNLAIQLEEEDDGDFNDDSAAASGDSAFAAFAAERGATELPDLLEAAAAYACFVEGRPHFSRPQVMKEAARAQTDGSFTREEGLRSFGTLLRQGKIRKLKRGQFVVTDNTRFKPKAG